MTLQEVLGTNHQICRQFYAFCQREFNAENIMFVTAVRQLNSLPCAFPWLPPELKTPDKIAHVYDRFIPQSAPQMVNINAGNRSALVNAKAGERLSANSFEDARREVEGMMVFDVFTRFTTSAGIAITHTPWADAAAAQPVAAPQPVIVSVVVPPSAPVLHLAPAPNPPDPKRHRELDPPPPSRHNQLPPPPNVLAAGPTVPPQALPLLRAHKPGPHLRNAAPAHPQTPPPLPPLPPVIVLPNLSSPPPVPPRPPMVVRNVYIVAR